MKLGLKSFQCFKTLNTRSRTFSNYLRVRVNYAKIIKATHGNYLFEGNLETWHQLAHFDDFIPVFFL